MLDFGQLKTINKDENSVYQRVIQDYILSRHPSQDEATSRKVEVGFKESRRLM